MEMRESEDTNLSFSLLLLLLLLSLSLSLLRSIERTRVLFLSILSLEEKALKN